MFKGKQCKQRPIQKLSKRKDIIRNIHRGFPLGMSGQLILWLISNLSSNLAPRMTYRMPSLMPVV